MKSIRRRGLRLTTAVAVAGILAGGASACTDSSADPETEGPLAIEELPITTSSDAAREHFLAGREALDTGDESEARRWFSQATQEDPEFVLAHIYSAMVASTFPAFRRHVDAAASSAAGASEGERLLVAIYETYLKNDAEKRLELSEELVTLYPRSPRAHLNLAYVLGGLNRNEEAREAIERAIRLDPALAAAYPILGFQYLFSEPKNFARAEASMRKFIELRPELGKGYEYLGDVLRAQGKLDRARAAYARAVEMDAENAVAALKVGHINSFLGNYDDAREAYDAALAVADDEVRSTYANYRAFTRIHEGNIDAALQELTEIVDAAPELPIAEDRKRQAIAFTLTNQALVALHHDRYAEAEEALRERAEVLRAIAREVGSAEIQRAEEADIALWQGKLAARRGDFAAAEAMAAEYRRLVEGDKNPRKLEAYQGLIGLIHLERGRYAEAAGHFRRANLNDMYMKYHLGLAEEGAGNSEIARDIFREVSEWNFNSVEYALVREETMRKYRAARDG